MAYKTFELFHISLIEVDQLDMLVPQSSRENWLRARFAERLKFQHHGTTFFWVPKPDLSHEYIFGILERQRSQSELTPPEDGANEVERPYWTGSIMIIDPVSRPDGQKLALENLPKVGQPAAILRSLINHLNLPVGAQYSLQAKPLFSGDSFWRFVDRYGRKLSYVKFRFSVPNMIFNAGGRVKDGLERIGKDTKAQEILVKLESANGILADSEAVQEGLAYGEEGNAIVTAKSLSGAIWRSTKTRLYTQVEDTIDWANAQKKEVLTWLKRAIGHDS